MFGTHAATWHQKLAADLSQLDVYGWHSMFYRLNYYIGNNIYLKNIFYKFN